MAEPVSTCVQRDLGVAAAAVAPLRHEVIDAALAVLVARVPVLHGRVLDLRVIERDQLDDRRVQLVLVAHRRRAALEIGNVCALVGDDERALELAGLLLVDAEVGRQLHRAAHALRHVDERAVREHRRVERGVEVVDCGTTEPRYFLTRSGCSRIASEIEQKMTPALASSSLKVVTTETLSNTASTATRASLHAGQASPAPSAECRASRRSSAAPDRRRRASSGPPCPWVPSSNRGSGSRSSDR